MGFAPLSPSYDLRAQPVPRRFGEPSTHCGRSWSSDNDGPVTQLLRRLVLLIAMLALVAGAPFALSIPPVLAAVPCPPDVGHRAGNSHHDHPNQREPEHDRGIATCFSCCISACLSLPHPVRSPAPTAPNAASLVRYWDPGTRLIGRLIRPD